MAREMAISEGEVKRIFEEFHRGEGGEAGTGDESGEMDKGMGTRE